MRLRPLCRAEFRNLDAEAERDYGLPTLVLMENAGRAAAEILSERARPGSRVLILCGPGNNGGDGGVVARHLDAWGYSVRVAWIGSLDQLSRDAVAQFRILRQSGIEQHERPSGPADAESAGWLAAADWIVDGLLGTGLSRPVTEPLYGLIDRVNRSGKPILALDLPSGLDCDTGKALGIAIEAKVTVTFVAPKLGFDRPGAGCFLGDVRTVEIGLPRKLLAPFQPVRMG